MRKHRIYVISPFSWQTYQAKQKGFAGTSESRVLTGFVNRGHEVHLLIPKKNGAPINFSYSGVFIHEFKVPPIKLGINLVSRILTTLAYYLYYFIFNIIALKRLTEIVKIYGRPTVIYNYGEVSAVYFAHKIYDAPNITRLFGINDFYNTFSKPSKFIRNHLCFLLFAFKIPCKYLIITNDGTLGEAMARRLKVPSERVNCWINGADFLNQTITVAKKRKLRDELRIPQKAHVIVSVSRLTRWKGVHKLISVVPKISSTTSNLMVFIIGEGEERESLQQLSKKLVVDKYVNFLGAIPHNDVEKYLHASDIFVSLYDFANLSSSMLEAMACGMCIVSNYAGVSDVLTHGETGILLGNDDPNKLSMVITHLLRNEDLRLNLGNNARRYAVENFKTWDQRVAMEIELIENLISLNNLEEDA